MIPTAPLRTRNRLAETILAALGDETARRTLAALATDAATLDAWLAPDERDYAELVRARAAAATAALRDFPPRDVAGSLASALQAAGRLFDAGLGFETHEVLEPHWARAQGAEREALQGLVQIAVGYQHLANGNVAGARALVAEGAARLHDGALTGLALAPFARAALASVTAPAGGALPAFPR